jgi:3-isopropylmalate/(R)-2-methylmalate dehydratase small subunit
MAGFDRHTGRIAVYDVDDVDTDRIIPARFLTRVSRFGYGELLFKDVRGPDFPLDRPDAQGATILVVGKNFGCGSSREHAVWAIQQAGFVAVVARTEGGAPGYSDIFRQNAANCGLLLVELDPGPHGKIVAMGSGAEVTIDLPNQTVEASGVRAEFGIDPVLKDQIAAGLDLIGSTMKAETRIAEFERQWDSFAPADTASAPEASNAKSR